MSEKDLSGEYELLTWRVTGQKRLPPGTHVELASDEATLGLAQGTVKLVKLAPAPRPAAEPPPAPAADTPPSLPAPSAPETKATKK